MSEHRASAEVIGDGVWRDESFMAEFTGRLITFQTQSGHRMTLKQSVPVVQGQGYVLQYNAATGEGRCYPMVQP